MTQSRVCWAIMFIWIISASGSSLQMWWSYYLFDKVLSSILVILLVGNFVAYLRIYLIVRCHQLQIQQQQHETNNINIFSVKRLKKSAVNTFLVFILLLVCYVPLAVSRTFISNGETISATVYELTGIIVLLNSSLNPLLYCWRVRPTSDVVLLPCRT